MSCLQNEARSGKTEVWSGRHKCYKGKCRRPEESAPKNVTETVSDNVELPTSMKQNCNKILNEPLLN